MTKTRATLFAVTFLLGAMLAVQGCGGGGGGGGADAGGSAGVGGGMGNGGTTGGGGMTSGSGGAGGSSGAANWHCAETAGSQCLCDTVIAYPQTTCQATFTCCYSAPLGARQGCVCENRNATECNALVAGTSGATRHTTCPPP